MATLLGVSNEMHIVVFKLLLQSLGALRPKCLSKKNRALKLIVVFLQCQVGSLLAPEKVICSKLFEMTYLCSLLLVEQQTSCSFIYS